MNLTAHFTFEELVATTHRKFIDENRRYGNERVLSLKRIADKLEEIRALLGNPIQISSGVRCPGLNAVVGGSKTSKHMDGLAVDFTCAGFGSPYDVALAIVENELIQFDQIIYEFGAWVHLGIAAEGVLMRRQVLSIHDSKVGYVPGVVLKGVA